LPKRTRLEITAEILQMAATEEGMRKTWFRFKGNLSDAQTNDYLKRLFENGYLEYVPSVRMYRTSAKGKDFLACYQRFTDVLMSNAPVAPEMAPN
jgi:predicted transcriptional regulator